MSEIRTDTINNASGDNDSGIDLSTNDQVSIKTANTTALTVDASQNVGIGTVSPSELIHANGSSVSGLQLTTDTYTNGTVFKVQGDGSSYIYNTENAMLRFGTNNLERIRIDSSGNVLVGTTDANPGNNSGGSDVGIVLDTNGKVLATANSAEVCVFNRQTSDGEIINLRQDGTTIGGIYSSPSLTGPFIGHINVGLAMYHNGNSVLPSGTGGLRDNAIDLGNSSNRFDDIYATNSTIQTSDRNEKQDIEELSEAEQRVAVVAKGLMRKFRWIDSVAEKGDNARTHFGIIAQDLQDAFTAEGLDAGDYAMFTSTTWWEKEISVDAVEADEENGIEAKEAYTYKKIAEEETEGYTEKTRLGVRYNQLLAFIISAL